MDAAFRQQNEAISSALAAADIRVLLMVLVHMTGDLRWLEPPFRPKRDVRLIPDPGAGLPDEVQREIRTAAAKILSEGRRPVLTDPGDELILHMMRVCLGENVPAEYAALNREEMGLIPRGVAWETEPNPLELSSRHVVIVGAGVCGIALAVSLGKLGIPFTIVEKNEDLGGTWFVNRYPGCGVDTPNHSYGFSFGQRHRWPRYFSQREEIHAYLSTIAERFGLRNHIRFQTRLTGAHWNEARRVWVCQLETPEGAEILESSFLVSAIGQLSDPSIPHIEGAKHFSGPIFHSVAWPETLSVDGKHVAVIGTGATAMQLVPAIANKAASIAVYQRTPQWSRPIPGYSDLIGEGMQYLLTNVPYYAEWFRFNMFWRYGDGLLPLLRKDPRWDHPERSVNRANDRHRQEMTDFIYAELGGRTDLISKCVPTYPPYGKRILLDNNWYGTLLRPNVELIDIPIACIHSNGIETVGGAKRKADIVVYSTGFKVTELAGRLNITGKDGLGLKEAWADESPSAFLGLSVPKFPNFFCMLGPGSGPGHGGSVVFQAECQSRYISSCIVQMVEHSIAAIDVRQDVHDEYLRKVDAEHEQLIWTHPGMSTYYRNRHGRVFSVMPWRFVDYWTMTHDPDLSQYETVRDTT